MEMETRTQGQSGDQNASEELSAVDRRGRSCNRKRHGGTSAAAFVLGLQTFEIMAIAAVGNNLITYVINEMFFSLSEPANIVTNFIGTVFIVALIGGSISNSYLGCYVTMLIFGLVKLSGFILLTAQAQIGKLKPPKCIILTDGDRCVKAKGSKSAIFFAALYLMATGSDRVKPNMIAQGADQFSENDMTESKKISSYFNAAYFVYAGGEVFALTILVWVQTRSKMGIGFGASALAMALGMFILACGTALYRNKRPHGTLIMIPLAQVVVGAILKRKLECPQDPGMLHGSLPRVPPGSHATPYTGSLQHTTRFRWLGKACIRVQEMEGPWRLCTADQVEKVKILISVLPIFACTIIFKQFWLTSRHFQSNKEAP